MAGLPGALRSGTAELLVDFLATVFKEGDGRLARGCGEGQAEGGGAAAGEQKWDLFASVLAEGLDTSEARAEAAAMDAAAARIQVRAPSLTLAPALAPVDTRAAAQQGRRHGRPPPWTQVCAPSPTLAPAQAPALALAHDLAAKRSSEEEGGGRRARKKQVPWTRLLRAFRSVRCPLSRSLP